MRYRDPRTDFRYGVRHYNELRGARPLDILRDTLYNTRHDFVIQNMRTQNLIHPGEILDAEFLKPLGLSQNQLALDLHVPAPRINAIVRGKRAITADTALRLGQYFKMEPQFWLNLQNNYDLGIASGGVWSKIKKLIPVFVPERAAAIL